MPQEAIVSESRIDWITCTARAGSRAESLSEYGLGLLESASRAGDNVDPFGFQGYSGQRTKHIFVGERPDGSIVRVGGIDAGDNALALLERADHCSRLDYCVTVYQPGNCPNYADDIWLIGDAEDPNDARLPTVSRTQQRWGGYTTYLGRRASAVLGRVYDKHAESKGAYADGSWRFELELKQHASEQEHIQLVGDPERQGRATSILAEQFRRWGLLVPWDTEPDIELWRTPPRNRDLDLTAQRLAFQYSKTAQRYVAHYGLAAFLGLFGLDSPQED